MKRFFAFFAAVLLGPLARMPAWAQLLTVGVGGIIASGILTPPSITPQVAAAFDPNGQFGYTNNGLKTNAGATGAMEVPSTPSDSWFLYVEGDINPYLGYNFSNSAEYALGGVGELQLTANGNGNPTFVVQRPYDGTAYNWWNWNEGVNFLSASNSVTVTAGSGYNSGAFPWTATGGGCLREPSGVAWVISADIYSAITTDPGIGCATQPTVTVASIPDIGAKQNTGASFSTSCVSNSPIAGEMTVTASVAVAHGLYPGQTFPLASFTPSGFDATYTALPGTSGATLVGETATGGGTCPASTASVEGTALSGTGGAVTIAAPGTTSSGQPGTGVQAASNQHFCAVLGEYGADSATPGLPFFAAMDQNGMALAGSPAIAGRPNLGATNFTGYTIVNTQSPSSPALTVTAMNSYAITNAAWASTGNGQATFTTSAAHGFVPGSVFTVSGMSPSGYNGTYIAIGGTTGSTLVGDLFPVATLSNPGSFSAGGSLVGVIEPGMFIAGDTGSAMVLPYGTYSSTGTGGAGTYGLTANQVTFTVTGGTGGSASTSLVVATGGSYSLAVGSNLSGTGVSAGTYITSIGTATGGVGTYTLNQNATVATGTTITVTGLGSSSAPVNMYAAPGFYYMAVPSGTAAGGGTLSAHTQAAIGDWIDLIGTKVTTGGGVNNGAWGGTLANVGMHWGVFPQDSSGNPSATSLASICQKTTDFLAFDNANSITPNSLYRLDDAGEWGDSGNATITGYLSGATGTSGGTATLNVSSTVFGSLALSTGTQTAYLAAPGLAGSPSNPATIPLTTSSPSTYAVTFPSGVTSANLGSSGSPVTFSVGKYKPATPIGAALVNGYISGTTLTVTGIQTSSLYASFTGTLNGTTLTTSGATGTIAQGQLVTDSGACITGPPLVITAGSGSSWTVNSNYNNAAGTGKCSGDAMTSTSSTVVPGQYVYAAGVTTPVMIAGYGTGAGAAGTYTISNSANGSVGSSGSPVAFTLSTITGAGAIAPGPALTITDPGAGTMYAATNYPSASPTGAIPLHGTYSTSSLGGTPSSIQAQISLTANGPAISGFSWTALSSESISGGNWSGTIPNVPAGGPYWISVRAANGNSYATLPSSVRVGAVFDIEGEGQMGALMTTAGGESTTTLTGQFEWSNWFSTPFVTGPAVTDNWLPARTQALPNNRYTEIAAGGTPYSEGASDFAQIFANETGGTPVGESYQVLDGVPFLMYTSGNASQTMTIGAGNGSATTFCSSSIYCGASSYGTLIFNASGLTGAQFQGQVSGATLTVNSLQIGSLMPGLGLAGSGISGSPTLVTCLTNCAYASGAGAGSTWTLSANLGAISAEAMTAEPSGGAAWPAFDAGVVLPFVNGAQGKGAEVVKAGSFSVSVNGTVECSDSSSFAYNVQSATFTCAGAAANSSFVNYATGAYSITLGSAPASNAAIVASWTNIISANNTGSDEQIDWFGNGSPTSGEISSAMVPFPGGASAHVFSGCAGDGYLFGDLGYALGAIGLSQEVSWYYGTRMLEIPGQVSTAPFLSATYWRAQGPVYFQNYSELGSFQGCDQWGVDVATKSTFTGGISGAPAAPILTLSGSATGPMWEGEVVGCATYSLSCQITLGTQITGLASGTWGASGSTYTLTVPSGYTAANVSSQAMTNAVYYTGGGTAAVIGEFGDTVVQNAGVSGLGGSGPHIWNGFTGGRRAGTRMGILAAAALQGTPSLASPPSLNRAKIAACDSSALASPCLDVGSTYAAVASGTISGSTVTFSSGLAANARPFVPGMVLSCSGCAAGRVITSVSAAPTQSTTAGAGQIGNSFTITASGSLGVSTTESVTGGCSGTTGVGSNCIDFAFNINTGGTYGAAAALATCGANNLQGSAANYAAPTGVCNNAGVGSIVRDFRIGSAQSPTAAGTVFDDGPDATAAGGGFFDQSAAYTCNIVAATVVQCVKGPAYAEGQFSSVGMWLAETWASASVSSAAYTSSTGNLALTFATAPFGASVGSSLNGAVITVSGMTGAGQVSNLNGTWAITSTGTSGTVINLGAPIGYTATISSSTGTIIAGSGTFVEYGDMTIGTGRSGGSLGNVGGQSMAFTAGSGYTNGVYPMTVTASSCSLATLYALPKFDISVAGGSIVDVYPSTVADALGYGIGSSCTIPVNFTFTASATAPVSGASTLTVTGTPGGSVGVGTVITDGGAHITTPLIVTALVSGTGGAGTYTVSNFNSGSISSETMTAGAPGGTGGAVTTMTFGPNEGQAGISSNASDNNTMGVLMYDNSGLPGNPLNSVFANPSAGSSAYFEPGIPVEPWGLSLGTKVSG